MREATDPVVTTEHAGGQNWKVQVQSNGLFYVQIDKESVVHADTLDKVKEKLQKFLRDQVRVNPVAVSITRAYNEIEHGKITGIHTGNENVLFVSDAGKRRQLATYDCRAIYKRFTPEQEAEYAKLGQAVDAAQAKKDAFLKGLIWADDFSGVKRLLAAQVVEKTKKD